MPGIRIRPAIRSWRSATFMPLQLASTRSPPGIAHDRMGAGYHACTGLDRVAIAFERGLIEQALRSAAGNHSEAARRHVARHPARQAKEVRPTRARRQFMREWCPG